MAGISMSNWKKSTIIRRADGSYVVPYNGYPEFHVPNTARYAVLWAEIDAYAQAHPEQVTDEPAPPQPTEAELLERTKTSKLAEINAAYEAATSALVSTYPQTELLTFDKQEAEARAWTEDNSAETPLVDALAAGRTMAKAELVRRIVAKADAFAVAVGYYTGQRQKYEDMVKSAETPEAVAAIVPVYTLPDMGEATDTETSSETRQAGPHACFPPEV